MTCLYKGVSAVNDDDDSKIKQSLKYQRIEIFVILADEKNFER